MMEQSRDREKEMVNAVTVPVTIHLDDSAEAIELIADSFN
jgi:hypothetical protein